MAFINIFINVGMYQENHSQAYYPDHNIQQRQHPNVRPVDGLINRPYRGNQQHVPSSANARRIRRGGRLYRGNLRILHSIITGTVW